MSHLLDQAAKQDEQRRMDLERSDALEKELIAADLKYLADQEQRMAQRIRETADMERRFADRINWMF